MGLFVSTVSTNIALSELGITLTHPVVNYRLDTQFNGDEIANATSLASAIASGTLIWKKTAGGTTELAAAYDPDFVRIEQLNTGTQINVDPSQVTNLATTVRSVILTGLSVATAAAIDASDTILSAFGKLQATYNGHVAPGAGHGLADATNPGFMSSADKIKLDARRALKLLSDIPNSSNATAVSLSDLTLNCEAGKTYTFIIKILFQTAATTTGIAASINGTAVGNFSLSAYAPLSNTPGTGNAFSGPIRTYAQYVTTTGVGATTGGKYLLEMKGVFVCTSSGTVFPIFRSEINGSAVTCFAGSTLEYTAI
jgi:hypothetical protein